MSAQLNGGERHEIAVILALVSRLAGMHRVAFQHLLASRHIPVHYNVEF